MYNSGIKLLTLISLIKIRC